jgi:hypothetical protein
MRLQYPDWNSELDHDVEDPDEVLMLHICTALLQECCNKVKIR